MFNFSKTYKEEIALLKEEIGRLQEELEERPPKSEAVSDMEWHINHLTSKRDDLVKETTDLEKLKLSCQLQVYTEQEDRIYQLALNMSNQAKKDIDND